MSLLNLRIEYPLHLQSTGVSTHNRIVKRLYRGTQKKFSTYIVSGIVCLFVVALSVWTYPNFDTTGTIKIYDSRKTLLYESAGEIGKKNPVPYSAFPATVRSAVIAAEDQTFWNNYGIDTRGMMRALIENIREGKIVSGASTITQQLARFSIISPQQIPKRTVLRKIREVLMALRISLFYTKQDILTKYLNGIYLGNLSYGVQSASRVYFDTDIETVSLAQSALLAGIISSPEMNNPFTSFTRAKERQKYVLDRMESLSMISKDQKESALLEPIVLSEKTSYRPASHAVEYVKSQLQKLAIESKHGLRVYTTIDGPLTNLSEQISTRWITALAREHDVSNAALVLLDTDSGAIRVMMGGVNYADASRSGQVNMATALRQPGSALKPVTYAAAFAKGYTPATVIYDVPTVYKTKKGEGYAPNNYDGRFHGMVLAREALASSLNLPVVELLSRIGIPAFIQTARDAGITTFSEEARYDLSLTLGGGEVTLLDLTNVYATFARGGQMIPPHVIDAITDDDGRTLYTHARDTAKPVFGSMSETIAYLISHILSDPKARMFGFSEKNPLVLSHTAAAKTGTTTDWHDNWTVGYTPDYSVGVWVGNTDNHPMRQITGVVGAAPIWHEFFEELLKGVPEKQFARPGGIEEVVVCAIDGKRDDGICPEKKKELFLSGSAPVEQSTTYAQVLIDTRNALRATESCALGFVKELILPTYPKEVYAWAVANNVPRAPSEFSPLCAKQTANASASYLAIVYPREKTVFENAPELVNNQAVVFEVSYSEDIASVSWFVDGKNVGTVSNIPFSFGWTLTQGAHSIYAVGETRRGLTVKSGAVNFRVVDYEGSRY